MAPAMVPLSHQSAQDLFFMDMAREMAEEALRAQEIPVGCVLVTNSRNSPYYVPAADGKEEAETEEKWKGMVAALGRNRTNESRNATLHAEFDALAQLLPPRSTPYHTSSLASPYFTSLPTPSPSSSSLKGPATSLTLYVTVEPCIMCASALRQVGIGMVIFGCANERFGGCGGVRDVHADTRLKHSPPFAAYGGYRREEAIMLLRRFYVTENLNAPNPKRKSNRVLKFEIPPVSTPAMLPIAGGGTVQ